MLSHLSRLIILSLLQELQVVLEITFDPVEGRKTDGGKEGLLQRVAVGGPG